MDAMSIRGMPRQLDGWEQQFHRDHRARKIARLRTRRTEIPFDPSSSRARDRPPDPVAIIKANARHLEEPPDGGPCRFLLRPGLKVLRHLAYCCWERSNLLDGFEASRH